MATIAHPQELASRNHGRVLSVEEMFHDDVGQWAKTETMGKLPGFAYWPTHAEDMENYIKDCIECTRRGPATKSQSPLLRRIDLRIDSS